MGDCGRTARLNNWRPQCVLPSHRLTVFPQAHHEASDGPASCSSSSASLSTSTPTTCWASGVLQPLGRHLMTGISPHPSLEEKGRVHGFFQGCLQEQLSEAMQTPKTREQSKKRAMSETQHSAAAAAVSAIGGGGRFFFQPDPGMF